MQIYRADGFTTDKNWEEIYNDRRRMRESVRKIARNSTAFNDKLQRKSYFYVVDASEDNVVIGALYRGGRDIDQQFAAFLGAVELELKDLHIAFCGAERPLVRYSTATRRWQRPGRNQSVEAGFMTTV